MSQISREEIAHLALLSRLALSDEEIDTFASQIDDIIGYVSHVQDVDTDGVTPMSHPHAQRTMMRADAMEPSFTPEQAVDQAPEKQDNMFVVPRILGQ
ncbi:MAG: Asp-tRNA(Asn)/Glu-tRNA(Gln) amidotransferase subunit GatC [Corynebacterium sp.]|nr:Asp-tRNA(Asn)/Glu-tRNA(Gln) amidotransferase subunit GatC [Corynebacterium sp.]